MSNRWLPRRFPRGDGSAGASPALGSGLTSYSVEAKIRRRFRVRHPGGVMSGVNGAPPRAVVCELDDPRMSTFVTAVIGINHNGSLDNASQLIDVARDGGADAVKFQKRTVELVYSRSFLDSPRASP